MTGRCSGVLGTVCACYPTCKEQRESDNIPQLPSKAPCSPGGVSLMKCTDTGSICSQPCGPVHQGTGSEPCSPCWKDGCCSQWPRHSYKAAKPDWALCLQGNSKQWMDGAPLCSPLLLLPPTAPPSLSFLLLFFVRTNVIWLVTPVFSNAVYG